MRIHHPPHIYLDETYYFTSARIYQKLPILSDDERKQLLLDKMKGEFKKFGYKLLVWVILDDHYHIAFKTKKGNALSKIMNNVHGHTSYQFNQLDQERGRQVWQKLLGSVYLRDKRDFGVHFNYIHHNPVKHGVVELMGDYRFSSYRHYLEKYGEEWIWSIFEQYPIVDFTADHVD